MSPNTIAQASVSDLEPVISIIETVAPNVATLLGGPLSGAITSGIVASLHVGEIGLGLSPTSSPTDLLNVLTSTPQDILRNLLAELEREALTYLAQQASKLTGETYTPLPYPDSGVEINAYDNSLKLLSLIASASVFVIGLVSPTTANLITNWGPTVCGAIGVGITSWLTNRSVVRSNANTRVLATLNPPA